MNTVDVRATIDKQSVAGEVAAVIAGKKQGHGGDIAQRIADPAHRVGAGHRGGILRVGAGKALIGIAGRPRADHITAHLIFGPFSRGRAGQRA